MSLTLMERTGLQAFGRIAREQARRSPALTLALERANMGRAPEVYLGLLGLIAVLAFADVMLIAAAVAFALPAAGVAVPSMLLAGALVMAVALPAVVLALGRLWPEMRASERGAQVDIMLPGALNYMAAMASSGVTPDRILASLARQRVYGEAAEEAHRVSSQVRWLGKDLLTALHESIETTPSARMRDVWQGMASTVRSGASLKGYLLAKAEQLHRDNASRQRQDLETLGIMAESFLVVAVAAPVFLILLFTMMGSSGGGGSSANAMLWLLVLVLLPVSQGGFAFVVRSMRRRV